MTRIISRGQNNWEPKHCTVWQRERRDGPILPMLQEKTSFIGRIIAKRKIGNRHEG